MIFLFTVYTRLFMSDISDIQITTLRHLQQSRDVEGLKKYINEHPEILELEDSGVHALLCLVYAFIGELNRAKEYFAKVKENELSSSAEFSDYGLSCLIMGEVEKAEKYLKKATKFLDADGAAWARLGSLYMTMQRLEEAEKCFERSLELLPDRPEVLANLGGIRFRQARYEEALELYNRALKVKPDFADVERQRNQTLIQLSQLEPLLEEYFELIEKEPNEPLHRLKLANLLIQAERYAQAESVLMEGIIRFPWIVDFKLTLVETLFSQSKHYRAGLLINRWLNEDRDWLEDERIKDKKNAELLLKLCLNEARIESHFYEAAEKDMADMEKEAKNHPRYYIVLARLKVEQMKAEEAVEILKEARERFPAHLGILNLLAHTLTSLGRLDEAKEVSETISAINPMSVIQHVEDNDYEAEDYEINMLEQLAKSTVLPKENRASAAFTLHRVLQKKKEYEKAFEVLIEANELIKPTLDYDWRVHRDQISRTIKVFTPELVDKLQGLGHPSKRPIFVLGMPRSGTTLTEQILAAHSKVFGAGELGWLTKITRLMPKVVPSKRGWPEAMEDMNEELLKSAAQYYLDKIAKLDKKHPHVVDKMPHNFDYVGLIALIFPNAKIIHLDRDPLDVAISNYQQNFAAKHGLMGFAFDLRWIGEMLNDHKRIMQHWHELFPGRIFELNYQKLVENPEDVIKEMLDFCELPWEDNVLRFYENKTQVRTASIRQVRKKIYTTSKEKWRRYEKFLDPVIETLKRGYQELEENILPQDGIFPAGLLGVTF